MAKNLMTAISLTIMWLGQAQQVQHFSFKDLPVKQVNELLTRGTISG